MSKTLFKRLSNGLPVLYVPMAGTESATVLAVARVGSRYETRREQGLSHMLEHMLFKGTRHWPTAKDLSQALDGVGADYNAFTSKDNTGYYVRVAAKHLPLALGIVSDMIWRPLLSGEELTREKKVICEEIKMYEDNPLMHIGDLLEGSVFQGSSLGVNIAGSLQTVRALTRSQLAGYHRKYYAPKNLLLVVAGRLPALARALVQGTFGQKRSGKPGSFVHFKPKQNRPRVVIQKKETQQVQLALGFPAYGYRHKRRFALDLLGIVLGGNMSSRLFMRLREREGLCYSVSAASDPYEGAGVFAVQAGLDTSRLAQAIGIIKQELERAAAESVGQDELIKAKEYVKGKLTLVMENSAARAQWAAKQYLFERSPDSLKGYLAKLERVSAAELRLAAQETFDFSRSNLALIGPFQDAKPWQKLIEP